MILLDAPLHTELTMGCAEQPEELSHRLACLGLRPGARVKLLGRTSGGGRMAQVGQSRVAIGSQLCRSLVVDVA
ncbi:MAG: ferrous iron transport protein A [Propionibacteriaceae bacterium]|jgi:Fe2+ transport system protein FeoA|nr:ferrous iron transport protein A [Propionibacteriaceae bacterium]